MLSYKEKPCKVDVRFPLHECSLTVPASVLIDIISRKQLRKHKGIRYANVP